MNEGDVAIQIPPSTTAMSYCEGEQLVQSVYVVHQIVVQPCRQEWKNIFLSDCTFSLELKLEVTVVQKKQSLETNTELN
jgi:hypothetical protein